MTRPLLADENVPAASVRPLRVAGYDMRYVAEQAPALSEVDVLAWAVREGCVLLTCDRDHGDLIYHHRRAAPPGVLYCRFAPASPEDVARSVLAYLGTGGAVEGQFVVLSRDRLRVRALPGSEQ